MGLGSWLKKLFGGSATTPMIVRPPATPVPPAPPAVTGYSFKAGQQGELVATSPSSVPQSFSHPAPLPLAPIAPPAESTDFDLGPFTPISAADLAKGANRLAPSSHLLWLYGRSNRIPPTDDSRTNLIDRAMVSHGLLTPQELAEIHAVGVAYDNVRPDAQIEYARVEQAITHPELERAQRKAALKAAAAERKQRRAEQVALRRQTDIVYLGRGVSSQLHDRNSDVDRLSLLGLPALATPADLAAAIGLSITRLRWLTFHSEAATVSHYIRFEIPKRSGGTRQLAAPHESLAAAQEWVLENILGRITTHNAAHGFVPGRSTLTNATPHVGKAIVVNADLADFFPTITFGRVRGIFKQFGYSPAVATILALLCTESPRRQIVYAGRTFYVAAGARVLPQGACTSPAISNLAARRLDSRLAGISARLGFIYTRYADDMTFSGGAELNDKVGYLLARVRHIAENEGFKVNEKKTRVQRPNVAQTVTGIVVNDRLGVPRDIIRRLRAILHRAKTEGLAAQNRENHPHFEAWVHGMVSYVHMINPQQAAKLQAALAELG